MAASRRFRRQTDAAASSDVDQSTVRGAADAGTALSAALHRARMDALLGTPATNRVGNVPEGEALQGLIERTAELFALSITDVTRKTYARRWLLFEAWCAERGLSSLPATPETVMLYLADASAGGAALGTIRGWAAAVNRVHLEAGHRSPGEDPAMAMFMRGISRVATQPAHRPVAALRIADLRAVCRHLQTLETKPSTSRDSAVLALSGAGLSDGAIARLQWNDVIIGPDGATICIRSPRRGVPDRTLSLRRRPDSAGCWVEALRAWRAVAEGHGPVFTALSHPQRQGDVLSAKAVYSIRRARLDAVGDRDMGDTSDRVLQILAGTPSEVLRDKAMLLLGFAGAFRRVDLARLRWRDVKATPDGLVVHLVRSKTDVHGRGRDVGIPHGKSELTCPVAAVLAWRDRVEHQLHPDTLGDLPVFVLVGRSGRIGVEPLSGAAITYVVRSRAAQAGLAGRWGGRSLRAGFISTAADLDIPLELIARQSRHANLDTLIRYIRIDDPFRRNTAARVGL